jgi:hypothetical protein
LKFSIHLFEICFVLYFVSLKNFFKDHVCLSCKKDFNASPDFRKDSILTPPHT